MNTPRRLRSLLLVSGLLVMSQSAGAQSISEASQLLSQGKAKEAYQLLVAEEARHAGNPEFDYLLGRAALDAGDPSRATLILERVLAREPNHAGARLDMARAYFALGNLQRAKSDFETLLELSPPPAARATITQYLSAIEKNAQGTAPHKLSAYAELMIGRDSNVTVGPRSATHYFPIFGQSFTIGAASRKQADFHHQMSAGLEYTHAVDASNSLFVGTDLRTRNYNDLDNFDQTSGELRAGWLHKQGSDSLRLYASYGDLHLGNERYRTAYSLGGDWRRQLDANDQLTLFAQTAHLRFIPNGMESSNHQLSLAGAGWVRQNVPASSMLAASVFLGREQETKTRTDGNKNLFGLRGALMFGIAPQLDAFGGATVQFGYFTRRNILYDARRRDRQYDLTLGLNWRFAPSWSVRPQLSWTRNYSNTSVNAYDRVEGNLVLRKDF